MYHVYAQTARGDPLRLFSTAHLPILSQLLGLRPEAERRIKREAQEERGLCHVFSGAGHRVLDYSAFVVQWEE
jgi:hypothetical protein